MKLVSSWIPVLVWMAIIFIGSSRPDLPKMSEPIWQTIISKIVHVSEYATLALLIFRALNLTRGVNLSVSRRSLFALIFTIAYGMSDEFHQSFVPGRTPSPVDVAIDTFGATLGLTVAWLYIRARARPLVRKKH